MRDPMSPAGSILALLEPLRKPITDDGHAPMRFEYLTAFANTIALALDKPLVSEVWRQAGFERDHEQFRRFLTDTQLDDELLRKRALEIALCDERLLTHLPDGRSVLVSLTDCTLNRKPHGRHVFGTEVHHDHAAKGHLGRYCRGHRQVLKALCPDALNPAGSRAYVVDYELFVSRALAEQTELGYEPRTELAYSMLHQRLVPALPEELEVIDIGDCAYGNVPFIQGVRQNPRCHALCRLQSNRALFLLPEPSPTRRPGRPRLYGKRWDWQAELDSEAAREHEIVLYERTVRVRLVSQVVRLRGYEPPVRVVASLLLDGKAGRKAALFLCTDTRLDAVTIVRLYGARFSLEETIKDLRHHLGWGREQVRERGPWQRYQRLFLLVQCALRWLAEHPTDDVQRRVRAEPWRRRRESHSHRLSLGEVQRALRVESRSGDRIFSMSRRVRGLAETTLDPRGGLNARTVATAKKAAEAA